MKPVLYILLLIAFAFTCNTSYSRDNYLYEESKNIFISGRGIANKIQVYRLIRSRNKSIDKHDLIYLIRTYFREANYENINTDVAIAQMCLETNFLRYTGSVDAESYNFAGIGATDEYSKGDSFISIKIGIRAHIQHLKAYSSTHYPRKPLVDPRFRYVKRGSCQTIYDLAGKWAMDPNYGEKIDALITRLLSQNPEV